MTQAHTPMTYNGEGIICNRDGDVCTLSVVDHNLGKFIVEACNNHEAFKTSHDVAVSALEELSCLGNGGLPGNSVGNRIAQDALDTVKKLVGAS